jgi:Fe-S-cluster containining protein
MNYKYCGTYEPCEDCVKTINCCNSLGKSIDLPIITIDELKNLSLKAGIPENEIIERNDENKNVFALKSSTNGGCPFYMDDACTIYENRPIDCRMFPFDIKSDAQGGYNLVFYTSACSKEIKLDDYIDIVDLIIAEMYPKIKPYIEEYALPRWFKLLDKHNYIIIKKLT